ncbi:MAG: hypothetical protein R3F20_08085 [Planctomycetota bacterium]
MSPTSSREAGSLLVLVPIALVLAVGLVIATLTLSTSNVIDARNETRKIQAYYVAKAGFEQQLYDFKQATKTAVLIEPFSAIEAFHDKKTYRGSLKLLAAEVDGVQTVLQEGGVDVSAVAALGQGGIAMPGEFDVSIHVEGFDPANPAALTGSRRFVTIRSTGWVPNREDPQAVSHTVESTVLLELSSSEVFDYAYFINNWGWFYGNTITSNGNVRSNGQFDATGYSPTIEGSPRYLGANGNDLFGYLDDNGDGVKDGSDGGIFAGWDIGGGNNVQGMAGTEVGGELVNQHAFDGAVEMPNLTDLALYEAHGIAENSSISIGGAQMTDAVFGDDAGETGNIVLIGTTANPIEIDGTVVVRGDVIIKGVVTGQGVIYAGGNVFVADDVTYLNPPTSVRPASNSEADFEAWLQANQSADALGLFARESVVLGNPNHSWFNSYVGSWMSHPSNRSDEDAGEDGIPNTAAGLDGWYGTADDDVLEDDGEWTTETYTEAHELLGLMPPGASVGDPIPGTGEDIDGDGQPDATMTLADLQPSAALNSQNWGGNLPSGVTSISSLSSVYIARVDAALYTNHAIAGVTLNWGGQIEFNGCVVSRNEAIVYGGDGLSMNHDARLLGGGENFGYYLPKTFKKVRIMRFVDNVGRRHFDEATVGENQDLGTN